MDILRVNVILIPERLTGKETTLVITELRGPYPLKAIPEMRPYFTSSALRYYGNKAEDSEMVCKSSVLHDGHMTLACFHLGIK